VGVEVAAVVCIFLVFLGVVLFVVVIAVFVAAPDFSKLHVRECIDDRDFLVIRPEVLRAVEGPVLESRDVEVDERGRPSGVDLCLGADFVLVAHLSGRNGVLHLGHVADDVTGEVGQREKRGEHSLPLAIAASGAGVTETASEAPADNRRRSAEYLSSRRVHTHQLPISS
jgi:hypothetical protein